MSAFHLHLMRHGAPETSGLLLGHTDMPASLAGIAACVQQVTDLSFGTVVASDLQRCAVTADGIAGSRALPVTRDPRWRELDFGAWDGLNPARADSTALARFWNDPEADPPPGGERWSSLVARVDAALGSIAGDTLVVTHGGAIRAAMACLFGFEQRHLWAFDLPYACVVSLRLWPGTPRIAQIVGLWP
ncbi:histidine phosphatase family protein [Novosphingobium olei]|uniref:Histidine phosphatase family protein n=1 Tax=Novosphingobium olei TaxID=2728851 RepID=A0A7Y0BSG3_9SPHN|nr:histidine phosphatase family protein [Novosphingobium olei]